MSFNPNSVGISNGNIFGFPVNENEANQIIIPVPWDVTASFNKGASSGPEAILKASLQLDFSHLKLSEAHRTKVFLSKISTQWLEINNKLSVESVFYNEFLESGGDLRKSKKFSDFVELVNKSQIALKENLYERSKHLLEKGVIVSVLGGDHSVPLGLLMAINDSYSSFGILQIDAHSDLRKSYQNFDQSHASVFYNVIKKCKNLKKLIQVGVRDFSPDEYVFSKENKKIETYYNVLLKEQRFSGKTWSEQVKEIISTLPVNVYISFDIDGLCPYLCPNTGTPVPGGLEFDEAIYLIFQLVDSGRKIIGFDLSEVSPSSTSQWDANVGARVLWNLVCAVEKSRIENSSNC